MCNPLVRALLGIGLGVALVSGSALAKVGRESKKAATKTVATEKDDSTSKDAAARRARIKKIGSAAPTQARKARQPAKPTRPTTPTGSGKKDHREAVHTQMANHSDGGSVAERRARIHSMQVPE